MQYIAEMLDFGVVYDAMYAGMCSEFAIFPHPIIATLILSFIIIRS